MIARWRAFGVALALTLGVGFAWAQQSSVGGLTSRPRFTSVAIGAPNSGLAVGELYTTGPIGTDSTLIAALGIETDEGGVFISGDDHTPSVILIDENEAGDNRAFRITPNGGDLSLQACADGSPVGACSSAVTITRTGSTVDSINLQATAVQVNGNAITGPVASGTYTPTGTAVTNTDSVTPEVTMYMRVGAIVHVAGVVSVDTTSTATATQIRLSLPIASNLGANRDLGGAAVLYEGGQSIEVKVEGDSVNNEAAFTFLSVANSTNGSQLSFTFTYTVL